MTYPYRWRTGLCLFREMLLKWRQSSANCLRGTYERKICSRRAPWSTPAVVTSACVQCIQPGPPAFSRPIGCCNHFCRFGRLIQKGYKRSEQINLKNSVFSTCVMCSSSTKMMVGLDTFLFIETGLGVLEINRRMHGI